MTTVNVAVSLKMSLGESPLWDHRHQILYWVDIHAGRIHAWRPDQAAPCQGYDLGEPIGSLALAADTLIAATASGIWLLDEQHRKSVQLAGNPEWQDGKGNRFNDGRLDPRGRFWVGTLDREETHPTAALYRLAADGLTKHKEGLAISNGLAFSPDGAWLYHADSPQRSVIRHRFNSDTGAIGPAERWIDLEALGLPGFPDGAAVDSLGRYWCALYGGSQVACFSPDGKHVESIELPCPHPTMVAFGGKDLKTLYVTTARQHLSQAEITRYSEAGSLLSINLSTPGLPEPLFAQSLLPDQLLPL